MKTTTAILMWLVMLPLVALGQMTPHYDSYTAYSVDANLNISQTVVVEGYTSTATGSCNTTCCQGMAYPPYYTCWSCPIPGCAGSTHTPKIYNVIGGVGGWSTGPAWNPFAYGSYQTTSTYHATPPQTISATTEADVICSVVGGIFSGGGGGFDVDIDLAYTKSKWNNTYTTTFGGGVRCFVSSWCTAATTPPTCDPQSVEQRPLITGQQASCWRYYNTDWLTIRFKIGGVWGSRTCFPLIPDQNAIGTDDSSVSACTKIN